MTYRGILIGLGEWGKWWCRDFLPPNIEDGLIEIIAAVDRNPSRFYVAKQYLQLNDKQCYENAEDAMKNENADFCIIAVNPCSHEEIVDLAIEHELHILSEKPIADTMEGCVRIAKKIEHSGLKMGITMSHKYSQDKYTFRKLLRDNQFGTLDYIIGRFTCDFRKFGSWGKFRHEMKDPLMLEGAIHHLDLLNGFTQSKCKSIYARTWKSNWAEYSGDCQALVLMEFENGKKAFYEGAKANAYSLNSWGNEYFRAECENATVILENQKIYSYECKKDTKSGDSRYSKEIYPLCQRRKWGNEWLVELFTNWLSDDHNIMETNVYSNLQAVANVFAAIESAHKNRPIYVQEFLDAKYKSVKI